MALYYTAKFRGTILTEQYVWNLHFRLVSGFSGGTEAEKCQSMAEGLLTKYSALIAPIVNVANNLVKIVVTAYNDVTGFYEQGAGVVGQLTGDWMPSFIALGFRQTRTNLLFRASKHAIPGVNEANNSNGSFAYSGDLTSSMITNALHLFTQPSTLTDAGAFSGDIQPVLIRTQYTTGSAAHPPIVTTYLDPHEIADVGGGAFYGLTSQVSRKLILGAS